MDLHLVTYFVAVVDHGGITKAAQSLYISQPSLSQAIRTLERRLGTTLFDRTGRRLSLTDEGRSFEVAARRILADVDRAKNKVAAVRELAAGRIEIVTFSAFSIHPVIEMVQRFRSRYPGILVRVVATDGPAGVHTALRRGEAEIGVTDLSVEHAGMITIPIVEQELVLAIPPKLAGNLPDPVARSAVSTIPLIVDLTNRSDVALSGDLSDGNDLDIAVDCAHPSATWELVMRGTGATIVPRQVAEAQMPTAEVRSLDPPLSRPVGLVLRAGEPSPAAAAFLAVATNRATGA
ncbi:LysR family transcriptional regulator [Rhodococcus zopfii]|uniref:LysR family transcriptional regulator n=1 Tax=Rhodococcus zopfii TaxID=43772 RepID=A0ABU3WXI4_9NOCA|nr:LysR family transcriptional regulator [Rhodococcus zopfii]